jgi:hypothetical protein
MSGEKIAIQLGRDESLVLFDLPADFDDEATLEIPSKAEQLALVRLQGVLENTLVEPPQPDYREKLQSARKKTDRSVRRLKHCPGGSRGLQAHETKPK